MQKGYSRAAVITRCKNGSAVIAARIPENGGKGFRIAASHSDSPCFKLKEVPEQKVEGKYAEAQYRALWRHDTEHMASPPSFAAGRVFVKNGEGEVEQRLVNFRKDLLVIPNVAVHFNREINDGFKYNPRRIWRL